MNIPILSFSQLPTASSNPAKLNNKNQQMVLKSLNHMTVVLHYFKLTLVWLRCLGQSASFFSRSSPDLVPSEPFSFCHRDTINVNPPVIKASNPKPGYRVWCGSVLIILQLHMFLLHTFLLKTFNLLHQIHDWSFILI